MKNLLGSLVITVFCCSSVFSQPIEILQNDLVLGLGRSDGLASIEWARGPAQEFGGVEVKDASGERILAWDHPFVQGIEFDNLNGISHNPRGNMLGVNFGSNEGSGEIISLATCVGGLGGQVIGNTDGLGGNGLTFSNLGGLSVSPDNSKIAVTGYGSGAVLFFDYTAGNCMGEGASLSNGRETASILTTFSTQGTTWFDDNSLLVFSTTGDLLQVDSQTLDSTIVASVETGRVPGEPSEFADIEYNPLISPYAYVSFSTFGDDGTINSLYVFDPRNNFEHVKTVDNSLSMNTAREIALDSNGNLFASQFGATVHLLGNVLDPAALTDDETVEWYAPFTSASFSGLDIAVGLQANNELLGDFDSDGDLDADDINLLSDEARNGTNNADFDLTGDGLVNADDRSFWVVDLKNTYFGDSNLDGEFGTGDLVTVFAAGEYEDAIAGNSGFEEGDWDGNGDFQTGDLIFAFGAAAFEQGPRAASANVPEPTGVFGLLLVAGLICQRKRLQARS